MRRKGLIKFGMFWDVFHRINPETGKLEYWYTSEVDHNLVVDKAGELAAGYFLGEGAFTIGNMYHAFGTGLVAWDTALPDPSVSQTTLVTEIDRKVPTAIDYLDAGNNIVTPTITDKLQIQTVLAATEPSLDGQDLREQGLFGGNATATANSGFMINAINHKKVAKVNGVQITRFIRLQF